MNTINITPNEHEILSLMWREAKPLTRMEILEKTPDRTWRANSIHIMLNSMISKGAVVVDGYARTGRNFGRTYSAAITKDEYLAMQLSNTVPRAGDEIVNIPGIISALVNSRKIDKETLLEIERIIKNKIKESSDDSSGD